MPMQINSGLEIEATRPLGFRYGAGVYGPAPEYRSLASIRRSLADPACEGPDPVYAIAMDVGRAEDRAEIERRMLLFGVVAYAAGRLGREPVRSQGHVHHISPHSGWRAPEIFEIWSGRAVIYMQQSGSEDPERCFAIEARPGERVVAPPGWPHAVISADPSEPLVFGAWCDRQYGFEYGDVRAHGGLAWFPELDDGNGIRWRPNARYDAGPLRERRARSYPELGLCDTMPLYTHIARCPEAIQWVSEPALSAGLWKEFEP
jgi:glucose-6-phosphate isomerase, archaeal